MALIYAVEDDKNILEIEMFALKNAATRWTALNVPAIFIRSW